MLTKMHIRPQTTNLFSTDEFEILSKKKAFVANISRGQIVDQTALIAALEQGKIRGAALDVADPEPLPEDHPLWKAPNIIISPHISGLIEGYVERTFDVLAQNLERKFSGRDLINLVNKDTGY